MGPEEGKEKKFSVGIFIALIILVAAAVAFGYFVYLFTNQLSTQRAAWAAGAEARMAASQTPEVTAEVTPEITPALVATETPALTPPPSITPALVQTTGTPEPTKEATPEPTPESNKELVAAEDLQSAFACAIRGSDGEMVVKKNADAQIYPASMSKVMTAIVAIENLDNLETPVVVYPEDIDPYFEQEASLAGFEPYEEVKAIDLLYGIMLPSGAEACSAIATLVTDTEENFISMMNNKAAELGMTGTHFSNVTGLHAEDHYTTCQDMAKLMQYAMKNDTFRRISGTAEYTCTATEQHPEGLYFTSTVFNGLVTTTFVNGAVFEGGKTGTTDEAGKCLASAAAFYGEEYFLVTAQAPMESNGNFDDASLVYGSIPRE